MCDATTTKTPGQTQEVLSQSEVTQAVICARVVEFRGTDLKAIIASVTMAFESGVFQDLPDSFTVRVSGGELSPASHRRYLARP